jgi:hypothetical protein
MDSNIPCINLDVNNCVNPQITLMNSCDKNITIQGETIMHGSSKRPKSKLIGSYEMSPEENVEYSIEGMIGYMPFTISYTVTKDLC